MFWFATAANSRWVEIQYCQHLIIILTQISLPSYSEEIARKKCRYEQFFKPLTCYLATLEITIQGHPDARSAIPC